MANSQTFKFTFKAVADMSDVLSNAKQLQNALNQLQLPNDLKQNFTRLFNDLEKSGTKAADALASGFKTKGDVSNYTKNLNSVEQALKGIERNIGQISRSDLNDSLNIDPSKLEAAQKAVAKYRSQLKEISQATPGLENVNQRIKTLTEEYGKIRSSAKEFAESLNDGNIDKAKQKYEEFSKGLDKIKDPERRKAYQELSNSMKSVIENIDVSKLKEIQDNLRDAEEALGNLKGTELEELVQQFEQLTGIDLKNLIAQTQECNENLKEGAEETQKFGSELDQFKSRIQYFFGLNNAVRLFQQSVRSAFNTIKDLDKVMTETAVVTKFDVGDMWSQLPEYTQRANELGVSIHDAYEAATLYYQQGLDTNEVMAVSNETLKMARIAGLDAADATDRMTNALRGFNMEITESNAQNINDVYSNLAAKTASNVDEISTAMTKVASLANNANMSFENTAAFLSQIIETTRESAETAGTALKTVIARFSEVKNLYSEGELLGDFEGEEIDVNKVSKALRTAGINLNEYLTGAKGLDDIFMELSEKWDSLDQVQQRYIATMAAGSRQQSRFIALMQDNARMTELVREANNATGASQEQFEKTLDSLETKLNQLKNAWDTFLMTITNNNAIKFVIDAITSLLTAINNLSAGIGKVSPALQSLFNVGFTFGSLKIGGKIFDKLFSKAGTIFRGEGQKAGKAFGIGLSNVFEKNGGIFKGKSWKDLIYIPPIKTSDVAGIEALTEAIKNTTEAENIANVANLAYQESLKEVTNAGQVNIALRDAAKTANDALIASNEALNQKYVALGITETQYNALTKANITQEQMAVAVDMMRKGSLEDMSEAEIKAAVSEEYLRRTQQKGIVNMTVNTTQTILNKMAKLGLIPANMALAFSEKVVGNEAMKAGVKMLISLGIIGAIIAAVALLTVGVVALIKAIKDSTPEAKLKAAQEAAEKAGEAAEEAAEKFDALNDSFESLGDKYQTLEDLTEGTREWRDAVQELNQEILKLIQDYPELAKFIRNEGGVLKIDFDSYEVQNVLDKYAQNAILTSSAAIAAQQNVLEKQIKVAYNNLSGNSYAVANTTYGNTSLDMTEEIAKKIATGELYTSAMVADYAKKQGYRLGTSYYDQESGTYQFEVTQEVFDNLKQFGEALIQNEEQLKANNDALAANAIQLAGLTGEETSYASNYLNAGRMSAFYDKAASEIGEITNQNRNRLRKQYAETLGYKDYEAYKKANDNKDIKDEDLRTALIGIKANELATASVKEFSKSLEEANESVRRLYSKGEGGALMQSDITALTDKTYSDIAGMTAKSIQSDPDLIEKIKEAFSNLYGVALEDIDTESSDFKTFAQDFSDSILFASRSFVDATSLIKDEEINKFFKQGSFLGLSADQIKKFTDNLSNIYATNGKDVATAFMTNVDSVMKRLSSEQRNKFADYLGNFDWTNLNDIKTLGEDLRNIGVPVNEASDAFQAMLSIMSDLAETSQSISVENLQKAIEALQPLRAKFASEEATRNWSKEEFEALQSYLDPSVIAQFVRDDEGNYIYLGNSMEDLKRAIEDATLLLRTEEKTNIENQIKARDILSGQVSYQSQYFAGNSQGGGWKTRTATTSLTDADIENLTDDAKKQIIAQYLERLNNEFTQEGAIEGLGLDINKNTTIDSIVASGKLDEFFTNFVTAATNSGLESLLDQITSTQGVWDYTGSSLDEILADVGENSDAFKALQSRALNAGMSEGIYSQFNESNAQKFVDTISAYQEAGKLDIDISELETYINELIKLRDLSTDVAVQVALANTKLNTGLGEIIDSYEDWTALINKSTGLIEATASDDVEVFNQLKESVEKMLNVTGDLSDEFWTNKENMDLIKAAAEGDVEAFGKLQAAALLDYSITIGLDFETEDAKEAAVTAINDIYDLLLKADLPPLEPGIDLSTVYKDANLLYDKFNEIITNAGLTGDQVAEAFKRFGYDVEIEYKDVVETVESRVPAVIKPSVVAGRHGASTGKDVEYQTITGYTHTKVPTVKVLTSAGSSGGGVSGSNVKNGKANLDKGKANKKSGKSSTPSYWKNPYDELFNLQEKINEALRKREALERRYQKLLKSASATVAEIRKGYYDQIKALQKEIALQKELAAGRKRQIQNLGSQYYTDSEGRRRTFSSMGVTKYAHYDFDTGRITIDWAGLEAIANNPNRTEEGEAAEAYINMLQELVDSYEETRDAIWDIEDTIEDLMQEAIDAYLSFEDRVMQAVIEQYQKEIDKFEQMTDAINDATNKMIDSIRQQIDAERQARDNAKTEQDIADMEARLAYLRRDTSGANDLQIMQLEKELEDARQNYEDSLIDQALEQMQRDADLAAEQRAQQLEVMRAQLEIAQENGTLWLEVYDLINSATGEDGSLDFNSRLIQLLKDAEAFDAMSAFAQDEWMKKLVEEFNKAMEGLAAGNADQAGDHEGTGSGGGASSGGSSGGGSSSGGGQSGGGGGNSSTPSNPAPSQPSPTNPPPSNGNSFPYGKASEYNQILTLANPRMRDSQFTGDPIKAIQWTMNKLGFKGADGKKLDVDGIFGPNTKYAVRQYKVAKNLPPDGIVDSDTRKKLKAQGYRHGGLVNFTGPAWLDGSRSNPEMVLSAEDTENFIKLKDVLARFVTSSANGTSLGNTYVNINIDADIDSDYSVDRLAERLKNDLFKDGSYRNVNSINFMR